MNRNETQNFHGIWMEALKKITENLFEYWCRCRDKKWILPNAHQKFAEQSSLSMAVVNGRGK